MKKEQLKEALQDFAVARLSHYKTLNGGDIVRRKNALLYAGDGVYDIEQLAIRIRRDFLTASDETYFGQVLIPMLVEKTASEGWLRYKHQSLFYRESVDKVDVCLTRSGTEVLNAAGIADAKSKLDDFCRHHYPDANTIPLVGYAYGVTPAERGRGFRELAGNDFWLYLTGEENFLEKALELAPEVRREFQRPMAREILRLRNEIRAEISGNGCSTPIDWVRMLPNFGI